MATLPAQRSQVQGVAVTYVAAGAGGDKFGPGPDRHFRVKNGSGASITVTIVVPGNTKYNIAQPDIGPVTIAAGAEFVFGPFPDDLGDPTDSGLISVTYSAVTTVTVAVVDV
jgi:hypothetical protein